MGFYFLAELVLRKLKRREDRESADKTTFMTRNGETVLKELIAASNGKYNPFHIFSSKELEIATNNYDNRTVVEQDGFRTSYKSYWKQSAQFLL